ncbi:MAG TPA: hypothetical protein VGM10_20545 [Actinocrinis sp.]
MTVGALLGVAALAAQAAHTSNHGKVNAQTAGASSAQSSSATAHSSAGATSSRSPSAQHSSAAPNPSSLPADSGSGARVVYSLSGHRVWIVSSGSSVSSTFQVVPGTLAPPAGSYQVTEKEASGNGSDGTPIQYVVVFGQGTVDGESAVFGFDAVAGQPSLPPAPTGPTGGIRMAQENAKAIFDFTSTGTTVVVVA